MRGDHETQGSSVVVADEHHDHGCPGADGSVRLIDAREQLLETDLLGASASSRSPSFCLLAAHIKWQIGARVKNKPPKREFARTWQLFLRQAESRST
jgi:hypothetical protein